MTSTQTKTFDPVRARQDLTTRLSRLDPGVIRTAAPLVGCEVRAEYMANVLSTVHAHLISMLDDMRGNLNIDADRHETALDQLNDIASDLYGDVANRVELDQ